MYRIKVRQNNLYTILFRRGIWCTLGFLIAYRINIHNGKRSDCIDVAKTKNYHEKHHRYIVISCI